MKTHKQMVKWKLSFMAIGMAFIANPILAAEPVREDCLNLIELIEFMTVQVPDKTFIRDYAKSVNYKDDKRVSTAYQMKSIIEALSQNYSGPKDGFRDEKFMTGHYGTFNMKSPKLPNGLPKRLGAVRGQDKDCKRVTYFDFNDSHSILAYSKDSLHFIDWAIGLEVKVKVIKKTPISGRIEYSILTGSRDAAVGYDQASCDPSQLRWHETHKTEIQRVLEWGNDLPKSIPDNELITKSLERSNNMGTQQIVSEFISSCMYSTGLNRKKESIPSPESDGGANGGGHEPLEGERKSKTQIRF